MTDPCTGFWIYETGAHKGRCCPKKDEGGYRNWGKGWYTHSSGEGAFFDVVPPGSGYDAGLQPFEGWRSWVLNETPLPTLGHFIANSEPNANELIFEGSFAPGTYQLFYSNVWAGHPTEDNAGKTCTAKSIVGESLESVAPTVGFSKVEHKYKVCTLG